MSFGRTSEQLDKIELSQLLVKYAMTRVKVEGGFRGPSQTEVAEELGVSQPMINGVIHGKKHFSKERFADYAQSCNLSLSELLSALLSPHTNNSGMEPLADLQDEDPQALTLLNAYEALCNRLRSERFQALQSSGKTFDTARAFSELLNFVANYTALGGIEGCCVALVSKLRDRGYAIWRPIGSAAARASVFRFRGIPDWLNQILSSDTSECFGHVQSRSVPVPRALNGDGEWGWLSINADDEQADDYRLAVQHVFTEESLGASDDTAGHFLLFAFDGFRLNESHYDTMSQVLFLASRFGEMVAMYCLQDRLRSTAHVIDAQLWRNQIASNSVPEESDQEAAEFFAERLLTRACDRATMSVDVVTADIWLLRIATNQFECPNSHFRFVSPDHANREVFDDSGERMSIAELYTQAHRKGDLAPRPFGRTNYMVANCVATFTNRADNGGALINWTSCPLLEFGTFIGIPFTFTPKGSLGLRHISVLYLRCANDLRPEESKGFIQRIVDMMRSEFEGRLTPMFAKRRAALSLLQRSEKELGMWYEVFQKRKKGGPDTRSIGADLSRG